MFSKLNQFYVGYLFLYFVDKLNIGGSFKVLIKHGRLKIGINTRTARVALTLNSAIQETKRKCEC